jgi:hypothetical protein
MKQADVPSRPGGEELGKNPGFACKTMANHLMKVRILPQQHSGFH